MSLKKIVPILMALLLLLPSTDAFANLSSSIVFDVRTGGSATNGGCFDPSVASPGTDWSQNVSAHQSYTDLVIGSTNTQLTSAAHPFASTDAGNCIQVTSGTGFTTGIYVILSVSGTTATMDRAVGTASSTGGNGNEGGSLADPGTAGMLSTLTGSARAYVQNGTYTYTSTHTWCCNTGLSNIAFLVQGYATTHGDGGTPPLFTTATNSTVLVNVNAASALTTIQNINFTNTASTRAFGFQATNASGGGIALTQCTVTGMQEGINATSSPHFGYIQLDRTRITASINHGIEGNSTGTNFVIVNSSLDNNAWDGISFTPGNSGNQNSMLIAHTIITKNGFVGINIQSGTPSNFLFIGNTISENGTDGLNWNNSSGQVTNGLILENNIFYGNAGWGLNLRTQFANNMLPIALMSENYNAFGSNTSGASTITTGPNDVTLTANPFVSDSTGNWALNTTAGGGAALKATGFPGAFTGSLGSTGYMSIGAVQPQSSGSSASNYGTAY